MIEIKDLKKIYRTQEVNTTALDNINLRIQKGESVAIMGPSGCGKTTLLNIIGLLDKQSSGDIYFNGTEVSSLSESRRTKIRKQNIGFIFQNFNLIDELSIYENVELPLRYLGMSATRRKKSTEAVLDQMEISHKKNLFPSQLSGGQQQKAAIARAVVSKPALILADEPTGNLDSINGEEVMCLLSQLNKEGTTLIFVTHSTAFSEYGNRVVQLFDGHIVTENINRV